MPITTFDPQYDAPSAEQMAAEQDALAQGEKILAAQEAARAAKYEQLDQENESVSLIGGKFKSQDDLLKAYEELQRKLSKGESVDEGEEPSEGQAEASDEVSDEEPSSDRETVLAKAAELYSEKGELNEETIEELSKMDSKELIKAYVEFYSKNAQNYRQQVALQESQQQELMAIAGGQQGYAEMVQWASQSLDPQEVDAFNSVTSSGNVPAIRFAVEALHNRYRAAEGYEAPLVSGKAPKNTGAQPYRSHAELARDIANPKYNNDPAFRADVEARLARSTDLL